MQKTPKQSLLDNGRFYILALSVCLAIIVPSFLRLQIESDQLVIIRTEQLYGLLAIIYWYIVLLLSPLSAVFGNQRLHTLLYLRRAIGVSAAFFAVLHGTVALFGQLGGVGAITQLPELFKLSLIAGVITTGFLLVMAATSFDRVIRWMTPKRWKLLHRTGYIGGILVLLHIWTIGTHASYITVQLASLGMLIVLGGLESYRAVKKYATARKFYDDKPTFFTLVLTLTVTWSVCLLLIPVYVENYHAARHVSTQGVSHE